MIVYRNGGENAANQTLHAIFWIYMIFHRPDEQILTDSGRVGDVQFDENYYKQWVLGNGLKPFTVQCKNNCEPKFETEMLELQH